MRALSAQSAHLQWYIFHADGFPIVWHPCYQASCHPPHLDGKLTCSVRWHAQPNWSQHNDRVSLPTWRRPFCLVSAHVDLAGQRTSLATTSSLPNHSWKSPLLGNNQHQQQCHHFPVHGATIVFILTGWKLFLSIFLLLVNNLESGTLTVSTKLATKVAQGVVMLPVSATPSPSHWLNNKRPSISGRKQATMQRLFQNLTTIMKGNASAKSTTQWYVL